MLKEQELVNTECLIIKMCFKFFLKLFVTYKHVFIDPVTLTLTR